MPLVLSACLVAAASQSVVQSSESPACVVLPSAASAAGFAELQAVAERPFETMVSPENGAVAALHGGRIALGEDPASATRELLTRFRGAFGLAAELEPVCELRAGPPPRVHVTFRHEGLEVFGVEAHVVFDGLGRLVGARVRGGRGATSLGEFELDETTARAAARVAISEQRAALARSDAEEPSEPRISRVWTAVEDGLVPTWRFVYPSNAGRDEAWTIDVDARSTSATRVLRVRDEIERGTGSYPTGSGLVEFKTGAAKASGFKNVAAALAGNATTRALSTWAVDGVPGFGPRPDGSSVFARADVVGLNGSAVLSPKGKFLFAPLGGDADRFDVANTAFQLESFGKHLKKVVGFQPGPDFAMPVLVNVFSLIGPVSFFLPTGIAGQTTTAGIIFTQPVHGPDDVDVSRDPTMVGHEWMHAVMHFENVSSLESTLNPVTAVREGIADFFAAAKQKDTVVGRCVEEAYGVAARDFADGEHLDRAFDEASASSPSGLPNDHRLGQVFAATLQHVRELEGAKMAERLAFAALPHLARSVAEISNQTYSVATAEAVTRAAAVNFATALAFAANELGDSKAETLRLRCAVIGAATASGLINAEGKNGVFPNFVSGLKPKLTVRTRIVDPDFALHHEFSASVPDGKLLRVVVRGREGFRPFGFVETGVVVDFKESADGTKVTMLIAASSTARFHVASRDGVAGRYDLTLEGVAP